MPRPFLFSEAQVKLMTRMYNDGDSCATIANKVDFECIKSQVGYALRKFGVQLRPPGRPQNSIPLSDLALRLITGHILGDGCLSLITPPLINSNFSLVQCMAHEDVILWTQQLLSHENVPTKVYERTDGALFLYTPHAPSFTHLRHLWYPQGKKIVPTNLELSPLAMLAWYLGDGSLHKRAGVVLHTEGFEFHDVFNLSDYLNTTFNLRANVKERFYSVNSWAKNREIPKPYLYIPKSNGNLQRFFDIVGPCPTPCMRHKWPVQ